MKPEHSKYSHAADERRSFEVGYQKELDAGYESKPSEIHFCPHTYRKH